MTIHLNSLITTKTLSKGLEVNK